MCNTAIASASTAMMNKITSSRAARRPRAALRRRRLTRQIGAGRFAARISVGVCSGAIGQLRSTGANRSSLRARVDLRHRSWHHRDMVPVSRLGRQIKEIILCMDSLGAATALIGGLALVPYNVIRATSDVDLLADAGLADAIDRELCKLGYQCLHRSADVANYVRGDERVDFLFAIRPAAAALLASAVSYQTPFGELRVVALEGLIAFKLQGFVNDPRRTQDLEDIRALLRANRDRADLVSIREYFRLFDREPLLDQILANLV